MPRLTSIAALAVCASGCCCSGLLFDDADLESAERDLDSLEVSGARLRIGATLDGRYVREHHGGGRFGYSTPTSEQRWELRASVTRSDGERFESLVPVGRVSDGWIVWSGAERDDGVEQLEGLGREQCMRGDALVFRLAPEDSWLLARAGDGWSYVARVDAGARDCASVVVPEAGAHLRGIWEEGVRAWIDLAEQRRTRPGSGMSPEGIAHTRAGIRACSVILDRGEAGPAMLCLLAGRVYPNPSQGEIPRRARHLVFDGAEAEIDLEGALFRIAANREPHPDAEMEAVIADHVSAVILDWLSVAQPSERMRAFVDDTASACAESACEPWRTRAAERLRGRLPARTATDP